MSSMVIRRDCHVATGLGGGATSRLFISEEDVEPGEAF